MLKVLYNEKVKFSLLYVGLQETLITELWNEFLCCVLQIPVFAFLYTGKKKLVSLCAAETLNFLKKTKQTFEEKKKLSCKHPVYYNLIIIILVPASLVYTVN